MNKKVLCLIAVLILLFNLFSVSAEEMISITENPITVTYNGEPILFEDATPLIKNGRTLVPVRAIMERAKLTVTFDQKTKTVHADKEGFSLTMPLNQTLATVNKNNNKATVTLEAPAQIINERTYVPVRFIAESLGVKVNWNPYAREVVLIDTVEWKNEIVAGSRYLNILLDEPVQKDEAFAGNSAIDFSLDYTEKNLPDESGIPATKEASLSFSTIGTKVFDGKNTGNHVAIQADFSQLTNIDRNFTQKLFPLTLAENIPCLSAKHNGSLDIITTEDRTVFMKSKNLADLLKGLGHDDLSTLTEENYVTMETTAFLSLLHQGTDFSFLSSSLKTAKTPWEAFEKFIEADNLLYTASVRLIDSWLTQYTKLFADKWFTQNHKNLWKYNPDTNQMKEILFNIHCLESEMKGIPLTDETKEKQKKFLENANLSFAMTITFDNEQPVKKESTFSLAFYDQPIPSFENATRDVKLTIQTGESTRDFNVLWDKAVALPQKTVAY